MTKNRILQDGCLDATQRNIMNHNFSDVSLCTTQLDATSNATLANVAGLVTDTLGAGQTYKFRITMPGTATANGGWKVALKQGAGLTLSAMESTAKGFTASAVAVQHSTSTTDVASLFASTTAVILCELTGTFTVNAAGTLQVQFAQNASHVDTSSVYINAKMEIEHITSG